MGIANGGGTPHRGVEQFWDKVDRDGECWEWTGYVWKSGYGCARYLMRNWLAHRLSWTFAHGDVPEGSWVLHRCDNPRCVRPDHLFLGTAADNVGDMIAKGRSRNPVADRGKRQTHCVRGHAFTPENTGRQMSGGRRCRACARLLYAERHAPKSRARQKRRYHEQNAHG